MADPLKACPLTSEEYALSVSLRDGLNALSNDEIRLLWAWRSGKVKKHCSMDLEDAMPFIVTYLHGEISVGKLAELTDLNIAEFSDLQGCANRRAGVSPSVLQRYDAAAYGCECAPVGTETPPPDEHEWENVSPNQAACRKCGTFLRVYSSHREAMRCLPSRAPAPPTETPTLDHDDLLFRLGRSAEFAEAFVEHTGLVAEDCKEFADVQLACLDAADEIRRHRHSIPVMQKAAHQLILEAQASPAPSVLQRYDAARLEVNAWHGRKYLEFKKAADALRQAVGG